MNMAIMWLWSLYLQTDVCNGLEIFSVNFYNFLVDITYRLWLFYLINKQGDMLMSLRGAGRLIFYLWAESG